MVGIGDLNVIEGRVSAAALNEAREWAEKNMDRLLTAWVEYR